MYILIRHTELPGLNQMYVGHTPCLNCLLSANADGAVTLR